MSKKSFPNTGMSRSNTGRPSLRICDVTMKAYGEAEPIPETVPKGTSTESVWGTESVQSKMPHSPEHSSRKLVTFSKLKTLEALLRSIHAELNYLFIFTQKSR